MIMKKTLPKNLVTGMKPMVYSIYNTATSQKGESMSDEDVTAKIDEAVRLIRDYIDAQVVVIGDAHKFWGYNKGRVDAYRDVSNLCDRLLSCSSPAPRG